MRPIDTWPSHLESVSPFLSELESRAKKGGSLEGYGISFSSGDARGNSNGDAALKPWDPTTPRMMRAVPNSAQEQEQFIVYAYTINGTMAKVGPVSLASLDAGSSFRQRIDDALASAQPQTGRSKQTDETHIYICTHGSRDCRCGVAGTAVYQALKDEVRSHQASTIKAGNDAPKKVRVFPISHVGGHAWAANALVYPHGDWYGNLRVTDSKLVLRAAMSPASSVHDLEDLRERLVHWPRWRGRLGLSKAAQRDHYAEWGPPTINAAHLTPRSRGIATSATRPSVVGSLSSAFSLSSATGASVRTYATDASERKPAHHHRIDPRIAFSLPALHSLNLTNNSISDLAELAHLTKCSRLEYLCLMGTPASRDKHYRDFVIWKLPQVRVLDYQRIRDKERAMAKELMESEDGRASALAASILRKSQGGAMDVDADAVVVGKLKTFEPGRLNGSSRRLLTAEERKAIEDAIEKSESLEEIRKLEEQLKMGHAFVASS